MDENLVICEYIGFCKRRCSHNKIHELTIYCRNPLRSYCDYFRLKIGDNIKTTKIQCVSIDDQIENKRK